MKASHLPAGRRLSRFVAVIASALAAVTCDLVTGPHADTLLTVEYNGPAVLTVGQIVDFDFRALENSGTLPWKYRGTPYEKVLDPDGVTTEYVRCPDPTASGIVIKITRTPWKDKVLRVCAMQRIAQTRSI